MSINARDETSDDSTLNRLDNLGDLFRSGVPTIANLECKKTSEGYICKMDVSGFKKEELKVEVEDEKFLLVKGEKVEEVEEIRMNGYQLNERMGFSFLHRIKLPRRANLDGVEASLGGGELVIWVPRKQEPFIA